MTRARAAVLGALLWCVVVVAVSSLVWVVISRAGAGVVPTTQPQADVTGSLAVPGQGPLSPGVTLTPRPSHSPSSGATTPGAPTSTPVLPGHGVAECHGAVVRLVAAYPNEGWRYLIGSRGPGLVQVRFVRVGEDGRWVTVQSQCVSGVPEFTLPPHEPGDN